MCCVYINIYAIPCTTWCDQVTMTSGSKFIRQVLFVMACVTVSLAQEQGRVAVLCSQGTVRSSSSVPSYRLYLN